MILAVKNQEDKIEGFLRSKFVYENNIKEIIVTDLDSNDNTIEIVDRLSKECNKIKLVSWDTCKKNLDDIISSS